MRFRSTLQALLMTLITISCGFLKETFQWSKFGRRANKTAYFWSFRFLGHPNKNSTPSDILPAHERKETTQVEVRHFVFPFEKTVTKRISCSEKETFGARSKDLEKRFSLLVYSTSNQQLALYNHMRFSRQTHQHWQRKFPAREMAESIYTTLLRSWCGL